MTTETRYIDPKTGGEKGSKPIRCDLLPAVATADLLRAYPIPARVLLEVGKVYSMGAEKYNPHNYRAGYPWSLSIAAFWRHYLWHDAGERYDPESGHLHLVHAFWHCLTLYTFMLYFPDFDDRYVNRSDDGRIPHTVAERMLFWQECLSESKALLTVAYLLSIEINAILTAEEKPSDPETEPAEMN